MKVGLTDDALAIAHKSIKNHIVSCSFQAANSIVRSTIAPLQDSKTQWASHIRTHRTPHTSSNPTRPPPPVISPYNHPHIFATTSVSVSLTKPTPLSPKNRFNT